MPIGEPCSSGDNAAGVFDAPTRLAKTVGSCFCMAPFPFPKTIQHHFISALVGGSV